MAETVSVKSKEPPPTYEGQPAPHMKHRLDKQEWRKIEQRNKQFARALHDIKREPPAVFHAPNGYASLRNGDQLQKQRAGRKKDEMPGTLGYVEPIAWPPGQADHSTINRARHQRDVDTENTRIGKKLTEIYSSKRISLHATRPELGHQPMDVSGRWAMRTSLYQPEASTSQAAAPARPASSGQRQRPASAPRHGAVSVTQQQRADEVVPKTLGVALCAGCGTKAFHRADGPGLTPCPQCKQVWYCSETCAKTDFQSHKQICKYHTTGQWQPFGQRPVEDYWVVNSAMAKARKELKQRKSANQRMSPEEEVEEQARLEEVVKKEKERQRRLAEKQAHIEWLAMHGMDGPRPCMYMNGQRI